VGAARSATARGAYLGRTGPLATGLKRAAPGTANAAARSFRWNGRWRHGADCRSPCRRLSHPGWARLGSFSGAASNNVDYHPHLPSISTGALDDWGVGAIGDMGAHLIDHTMWALTLAYLPASKRSRPHSTCFLSDRDSNLLMNSPLAVPMPPVKSRGTTGASSPTSPKSSANEKS